MARRLLSGRRRTVFPPSGDDVLLAPVTTFRPADLAGHFFARGEQMPARAASCRRARDRSAGDVKPTGECIVGIEPAARETEARALRQRVELGQRILVADLGMDRLAAA